MANPRMGGKGVIIDLPRMCLWKGVVGVADDGAMGTEITEEAFRCLLSSGRA